MPDLKANIIKQKILAIRNNMHLLLSSNSLNEKQEGNEYIKPPFKYKTKKKCIITYEKVM
jgi:hypothetical protein